MYILSVKTTFKTNSTLNIWSKLFLIFFKFAEPFFKKGQQVKGENGNLNT